MSDTINDGSVQFGSRRLSIGGNEYATDDFSYENDYTEIIRTNEQEVPDGQVIIKGRVTGTATLQLQSGSTPLPAFGQSFVEDEGTFWIRKVGRAETKGGETKVPIEFVGQLSNTVSVS